MLCELVGPDSTLWRSCLRDVRHDFYHVPEYVQLCADLYDGGVPRAFIAREEAGIVLVPLIFRPIETWISESNLFDAIGPYGYASPIVLFPNDSSRQERFLERAVEGLVKCLLDERVVALFCRLHPMLDFPLEPLQRSGTVVEHGPTVFCDLTRSADDLWKETREAVRRKIKRIKAEGFVADEDASWESLADFEAIYKDTMQRVGASDWYFFHHDHFARLRDDLHDNMHLLTVRHDEQVVCAGLFSETCRIVQYHLGGTRAGFEESDAIKLLIHFAREWAQARGNEVFHLGGGVGAANDSLLYFKSGFSKLRSVFRTWRLVVDPKTYSDLVAARRMRAGITMEGPSSYFPEYRMAVGAAPGGVP